MKRGFRIPAVLLTAMYAAVLCCAPCAAEGDSFVENLMEYDHMGMYTINGSYITFGYNDGDAGVIITDCSSEMSGELTIPDTLDNLPVVTVGEGAFYNCAGITGVRLPKTVTAIADGAFYGCTKLKYAELSDALTDLGQSAFYQCSVLEAIHLPEKIKSIPNSCFAYCTALREITWPSALETIEAQAFYGSQNMPELILPETVIAIGDMAFYYWNQITTVTLPASVKTLGSYVFDGCDALTEICVADDNTAYCDMDGVLFDHEKTTLIKYPSGKKDSAYTVPDGVAILEGWSFIGATALKQIDLNDVTQIGEEAFYFCTALEQITLPMTLETLEQATFAYCSSLSEIVIPETVTEIGAYCFASCSALKSLAIPAAVEEIGEYAMGYHYNQDTQELKKIKGFRMRVIMDSAGMEYAKTYDVSYRSNSKLGFILGILFAVLMIGVIITVIVIRRRNCIRIGAGPNKGKPVPRKKPGSKQS